jgi:hypothetical protein
VPTQRYEAPSRTVEITAGSRQYVLFDADADRIDALPTWDW